MKAFPIRMALAGVGGYGKVHLRMIEVLARENLVKLIAVADPFLEDMPEIYSRLVSQNVRCYEDYQQLLDEQTDLDFISIASPIPLHESMVKDALARDLHIYIEKPPVPTIQQLLELIRLDRQGSVTVGFQMAQFPQVQQLKEWIAEGALGAIQHITATACWPRPTYYYDRANWAGRLLMDGQPVLDGPASNGLAHLIQMIMFFCGPEGNRCAVPEWVEGEFYRVRPIESYDLAGIAGGFSTGTRFTALLAHCGLEEVPFSIRIKGTQGKAWLSNDGATVGNDCGLKGVAPCEISPMAGLDFYRNVFRGLGDGEPPVTSLRDCLGYAKTVSGGIISSGGIHTLERDFVSTVGTDSNMVYDLKDFSAVLEKASLYGKLPSQQGLPWAVKGKRIQTSEVEHLDLKQFVLEKIVAGSEGVAIH